MRNGNVYEMNGLRVIDMAKHVDPQNEARLCNVERHGPGIGPVPGFGSTVTVTTHLGTHIECPAHQHNGWPSVGELPVTTFIGRDLLVDFKDTVECVKIGTTWMFHEIMLQNNKPFVEVLQNVEELHEDHFPIPECLRP